MASGSPQKGDVLLMVGTRKGSFLYWSDPDREQWQRAINHEGLMVHHMIHDPRDNSIYAATNSGFFDAIVQRTPDFGQTWEKRSEKLDYPGDSERRVRKVWHLATKPEGEAGHLYAGVERAGLFATEDFGATWESIEALNGHEHSEDWTPGGGGLILHTIVVDPEDHQRIYVAISAAGVYRSDDGGKTWHPKNSGVRADFLSEEEPEFGQCVHTLAMHPSKPELLYQQNHCGVYRSEDRGDTWTEITEGLPSEFGFPFAVHTHDPNTIYVVPLVGSGNRVVPDGKMTVWRSRDRGDKWEALTQGLPEGAYLTILREAMAVDDSESCGVYVGTETGQLFFSRDEGDHWETLADYLPPVYSITTGRVA
jgi:photosystem II stability/assembly factor-like uncharacterized protein